MVNKIKILGLVCILPFFLTMACSSSSKSAGSTDLPRSNKINHESILKDLNGKKINLRKNDRDENDLQRKSVKAKLNKKVKVARSLKQYSMDVELSEECLNYTTMSESELSSLTFEEVEQLMGCFGSMMQDDEDSFEVYQPADLNQNYGYSQPINTLTCGVKTIDIDSQMSYEFKNEILELSAVSVYENTYDPITYEESSSLTEVYYRPKKDSVNWYSLSKFYDQNCELVYTQVEESYDNTIDGSYDVFTLLNKNEEIIEISETICNSPLEPCTSQFSNQFYEGEGNVSYFDDLDGNLNMVANMNIYYDSKTDWDYKFTLTDWMSSSSYTETGDSCEAIYGKTSLETNKIFDGKNVVYEAQELFGLMCENTDNKAPYMDLTYQDDLSSESSLVARIKFDEQFRISIYMYQADGTLSQTPIQ